MKSENLKIIPFSDQLNQEGPFEIYWELSLIHLRPSLSLLLQMRKMKTSHPLLHQKGAFLSRMSRYAMKSPGKGIYTRDKPSRNLVAPFSQSRLRIRRGK